MKTTNNTVLITGGSAGIGFEIARVFAGKGNKVIITGRNPERLEQAVEQLNDATGIVCDVTKENEVQELVATLTSQFPELNVVVNNAGQAYINTLKNDNAFEKASDEMLTNYLSIIRLNEQLLPLLKKQEEAAIVNVSSIVGLVPNNVTATYGASKAALHSYTQSLRIVLERTGLDGPGLDGPGLDRPGNVKVFELMPPLVNTDFSQAIGGANGIAPSVVADDLIDAFENDRYEIHVGRTADIYALSHAAPADALLAMNPA